MCTHSERAKLKSPFAYKFEPTTLLLRHHRWLFPQEPKPRWAFTDWTQCKGHQCAIITDEWGLCLLISLCAINLKQSKQQGEMAPWILNPLREVDLSLKWSKNPPSPKSLRGDRMNQKKNMKVIFKSFTQRPRFNKMLLQENHSC